VHAFNEDDNAMAATFATYWTSLAAGGDPNSDAGIDGAGGRARIPSPPPSSPSSSSSSPSSSSSVPFWASVDANAALADMPHMQLEMPASMSQGLEADTCDFWDEFLGY
jgi:hypothetical protein